MKAEEYRQTLAALLRAQLAGEGEPLDEYLAAHSNLPSPAANFTLLHATVDVLTAALRQGNEAVWDLLARWAAVPATEAPANHPREFLPFAAALANGAIGAEFPAYFDAALARLRQQAGDPRWRTREMVAAGLQALARVRFPDLWYHLHDWVDGGDFLALRAVAAALAEPDLVADKEIAQAALGLHAEILARVQATPAAARKSPEFRALRQGLGYTLSVVATGVPKETFALLRAWATIPDRDVRYIIRENLQKARLRRFSEQYTEYKSLTV